MGKIHLSTTEQIMFFRQFGLMLQGGLSLLDSLRTLGHHLKSKKAKPLVQNLLQETEQGRQLSQSLSLYHKTFDPMAISLVEIGETSGTLANSLLAAAQELQQRHNARKKIITALIYPAIVIMATGGVVGLLVFYVFPKVLPVFDSVHAKLPLTTRLLIAGDNLVREQGLILLILLGLIITGVWLGFTRKRFKKLRDQWLLSLPLGGRIAKNYILAHICRTLGQLLQQQIPMLRAVIITGNATPHTLYKQRLIALSMAVSRGQSLTQFFADESPLFPPIFKQLIAVGEKTGTLSENLLFLGQLYDEEISDAMSRMSVMLEPAMMIVIGGVVGFVAISVITPIYQITQNLHA